MDFKEKLSSIANFIVDYCVSEIDKDMMNELLTKESIEYKANNYFYTLKDYVAANPDSDVAKECKECQSVNMFESLLLRRILLAIYEKRKIDDYFIDPSLQEAYDYEKNTYQGLIEVYCGEEIKRKM